MFEIFNGFESILAADFFVTENARSATKGHSFTITKVHSRVDMRKYSFNQRIVIDWSSLKQRSNTNITQFKGYIGKYLKHRAEDHTSQRFTPFLDYNKYVKMEDKGKSHNSQTLQQHTPKEFHCFQHCDFLVRFPVAHV